LFATVNVPAMEGRSVKKILASVYTAQFLDSDKEQVLAGQFNSSIGEDQVGAELLRLESSGMIRKDDSGGWKLTEAGRDQIVVVMTGGAFDIIHPGHVETLERARSLGDVLIVSVARNSTYAKNKKKNPLHDELLRKKMVGSIKSVDAAILGSEIDIYETVGLLRPNIIALGYDQAHSENAIRSELSKRGLKAQVVRLDSSVPSIKSSKIAQDYY
jgi:FAD synthetase